MNPVANRYFATLADLEQTVTERCRMLHSDQLKPGTNFHWWPRAVFAVIESVGVSKVGAI